MKKVFKKALSFMLALALVLAGTGTFAGLSGILAPAIKARAEGAELNHAVTAGTVYRIGSHDYVATATANSGDVMFIAKEPTTQTYTFYELNEVFVQGAGGALDVTSASNVVSDLDTAGLIPALSMSEWSYYVYPDSDKSYLQGFFGVPTKEDVEAAPGFSVTPAAWTTSKQGLYNSNSAYYVDGGSVIGGAVSDNKKALVAFRLNLSAEGVYVYTKDGTNYITHAIPIDEEHFPDENFRNYLLSQSYGSDAELTREEVEGVTKIVVNGWKVENFSGIEYFTSLEVFSIAAKRADNIDFSKFPNLRQLTLHTVMDINNVDLHANSNLEDINIPLCLSLTTPSEVVNERFSNYLRFDNQNTMYYPKKSDGTLDFDNGTDTLNNLPENLRGVTLYSKTVKIDEINFPDPSFRAYLCRKLEVEEGSEVTEKRLSEIDFVDIQSYSDISDLTGIEYLKGLDTLYISRSRSIMSSLDLTENVKISHISLPDSLKTLTLPKEPFGESFPTSGHYTDIAVKAWGTDSPIDFWFMKDANGDLDYNTPIRYMEDAPAGTTIYKANNVGDDEVSLSQNIYTYDGITKKPTVRVSHYIYNGETYIAQDLVEDRDYTVEYFDNTEIGTAKVVVKGKGIYDFGRETDTDNNIIYNTGITKGFVITPEDGFKQLSRRNEDNNGLALYKYDDGVLTIYGFGDMVNLPQSDWDWTPEGEVRYSPLEATINNDESFSKEDIKEIRFDNTYGTAKLSDRSDEMFSGMTNLERVDFTNADVSNVREFGSAFKNCAKLESIDLTGFNISNIWDTGIVRNEGREDEYTTYWFEGCTSLHEIKFPATGEKTVSLKGIGDNAAYEDEWLDEDGNSVVALEGDYPATASARTIHLNAVPDTYNITYDLNGGALPSGVTNPDTYREDTAGFTLNNPERNGYIFKGWTGSNGTTPQTTVTVSAGTTGDLSYTAVWELQSVSDDYHIYVDSQLKLNWQGLTGDPIVKHIGNVTVTCRSKSVGRFAGSALITVDPTSLPAGRSIKISVPVKDISLTIGGRTVSATVDFDDVILDKDSGSRQYTASVVTVDGLAFDDYFGKPIVGEVVVKVDEL